MSSFEFTLFSGVVGKLVNIDVNIDGGETSGGEEENLLGGKKKLRMGQMFIVQQDNI